MGIPKTMEYLRSMKGIIDITATGISRIAPVARANNQAIIDTMGALGYRLELTINSNLNIGDEVYIEEYGTLTAFICVGRNLYITTGENTLLMRKFPLGGTDIKYGDNKDYSDTTISTYLTNSYRPYISVSTVDVILPCTKRDGSAYNLTSAVFIPSVKEVTNESVIDPTTASAIAEGSQFPYFVTDANRIRYFNTVGVGWANRTPYGTSSYYIIQADGTKTTKTGSDTDKIYIVPVISVSSTDYSYKAVKNNTGNIFATATI